jgi:hypothetical protein
VVPVATRNSVLISTGGMFRYVQIRKTTFKNCLPSFLKPPNSTMGRNPRKGKGKSNVKSKGVPRGVKPPSADSTTPPPEAANKPSPTSAVHKSIYL